MAKRKFCVKCGRDRRREFFPDDPSLPSGKASACGSCLGMPLHLDADRAARTRRCSACGAAFQPRPSKLNTQKTCSDECARKRRSVGMARGASASAKARSRVAPGRPFAPVAFDDEARRRERLALAASYEALRSRVEPGTNPVLDREYRFVLSEMEASCRESGPIIAKDMTYIWDHGDRELKRFSRRRGSRVPRRTLRPADDAAFGTEKFPMDDQPSHLDMGRPIRRSAHA